MRGIRRAHRRGNSRHSNRGSVRTLSLAVRLAATVLVVAIASAASFALLPSAAHAFKAGGHYALAAHVRDSLPVGNPIRTAMENEDACMAWGSNGPDIPAGTDAVAFGMAEWFDNYHDLWPGPFSALLLRNALASGDQKKIAFAAGYITHLSGDLNVHGLLVNPRAGMYIVGDRGLHADLEAYADPVTWRYAGLDPDDYDDSDTIGRLITGEENELWTHYAEPFLGSYRIIDPGPGVRDLLQDTTAEYDGFDNNTLGYNDTTFYQLWEDDDWGDWLAYWGGLLVGDASITDWTPDVRQYFAGLYKDYDDSVEELGEQGVADVKTSFDGAAALAEDLLLAALDGDYSGFHETWYMDAGPYPIDQRGIGNLIIRVSTQNVSGAGTDDAVYFEFQTVDGRKSGRLLLDNGVGKIGNWYSDFEGGDNDTYQLFYPQTDISPSQIARVWLYKEPDGVDAFGIPNGGWRPNQLEVYINGRSKILETCPKWLQDDDRTWTIELSDEWRQSFIPTLTDNISGTVGNAGWYRSDVRVDLTATERALSGGVFLSAGVGADAMTEVEGRYSASKTVTVTAEGHTDVKWSARDYGGDTTGLQTKSVAIDKTAPTITNLMTGEYLTGQPLVIAWGASDSVSGLYSSSATLDGLPIALGETLPLGLSAGRHSLYVTAEDVAGNSKTQLVEFEVFINARVDKVDPYYINPLSTKGTISFFIEFPDSYDVALIKPATCTMSVNGVTGVPAISQRTTVKDYDRDGRLEYVLKFDRERLLTAIGSSRGEVEMTLRGRLEGGLGFVTGTPCTAVVTDPSGIVPPRVP